VNHRLGLVFLEASSCTLKARGRTFIACAKAFDLFLAKHFNLLMVSSVIRQVIIATVALAVCATAHIAAVKEIGCTGAVRRVLSGSTVASLLAGTDSHFI